MSSAFSCSRAAVAVSAMSSALSASSCSALCIPTTTVSSAFYHAVVFLAGNLCQGCNCPESAGRQYEIGIELTMSSQNKDTFILTSLF